LQVPCDFLRGLLGNSGGLLLLPIDTGKSACGPTTSTGSAPNVSSNAQRNGQLVLRESTVNNSYRGLAAIAVAALISPPALASMTPRLKSIETKGDRGRGEL